LQILQISAFHPKHGIILAEPYEQFDGTKFRDSAFVRQYRTRMLRSIKNGTPGFGLRFESEPHGLEIDLDGLGRAKVSYGLDHGVAITTTLHVSESGAVIQSAEIKSVADTASRISYVLDFGISVNRASYGQLTEGGPIPIPRSENKLSATVRPPGLSIKNAPLDAHLEAYLQLDGQFVDLHKAIQDKTFDNSPVVGKYSQSLRIPPRGMRILTANFSLRPGVVNDAYENERLPQQVGLARLWKGAERVGRFIVRRNLEYILGNCAIPVPPTKQAVCLLTDHVALPLGWMRDN
jgi:uncharacterized protein